MDRLARLRQHLHAGGSTTLHEAAAACGLSNSELERWIAEGRLRYSTSDSGPTGATVRCSVCGHGSRSDVCESCRTRLIAAGQAHYPEDAWRRHESAESVGPRKGLHTRRGRVIRRR